MRIINNYNVVFALGIPNATAAGAMEGAVRGRDLVHVTTALTALRKEGPF